MHLGVVNVVCGDLLASTDQRVSTFVQTFCVHSNCWVSTDQRAATAKAGKKKKTMKRVFFSGFHFSLDASSGIGLTRIFLGYQRLGNIDFD